MSFLFHLSVTAMMLIAFATSLAIKNTPDIREPHIMEVGRNLITLGWGVLAVQSIFSLFAPVPIMIPQYMNDPVTLVGVGALALGASLNSLFRLMPRRFSSISDQPFGTTFQKKRNV